MNFQIFKLVLEKAISNQRSKWTRDQIANICWIIKKVREFQKNIYFCFIDYAKAFDCEDPTNCGKFFKRWEYQTTLFDLYAEHIMQNAMLCEAQAGVKIAGRNINNLRYADDTPAPWQKVKKN